MFCDKLYELAFSYKKTRLWERVWSKEIFAIKLSDGEIGYVQIVNGVSEGYDLNLYIGEEGIQNFLKLSRADIDFMDPIEVHENQLSRNFLQCSFVGKEELYEEELEQAREYAKKQGIKIAGRNAYPRCSLYQPGCYRWYIQNKQQQEYLCEAIEAAIAVSEKVEGISLQSLGRIMEEEELKVAPLVEKKHGEYVWSTIEIPSLKKEEYPMPKLKNEINLAKLKKIKKSGVWQCSMLHHINLVQETIEDIPFFPVFILVVEEATDYVLPVDCMATYEDSMETMLENLVQGLLKENICPGRLKVRNEKDFAFFKDFCEKLKISLSIEEDLDALDEAQSSFYEYMSMDEDEEFENMLEMIMELPDSMLQEMPSEMVEELRNFIDQGLIEDEFAERLSRVLGFSKKK